jgi:DNA-binding IclR family transcriptional regulator
MWWADMLARKTGEAVWAGELRDGEIHIVHQAVRPDELIQVLDGNAAIPWYACALGQAIVAAMPAPEVDALVAAPLRALTGRTRTAPDAVRKALAAVADKGFAVENQEANVGDGGIAAAIFDHGGRAVGSMGVVGPAERLLQRQARAKLSRAVVETARAVSRDLGASRGLHGDPRVTHRDRPPR